MKTSDILTAAKNTATYEFEDTYEHFRAIDLYFHYFKYPYRYNSEQSFDLAIRDALNEEANEGVYL